MSTSTQRVLGTSIHQPNLELQRASSPANIQLLIAIQSDEVLFRSLSEVSASWRPKTLIHSHLKLDIILVVEDSGGVRLVDWELATIGDPRWI